jgi:hypothetical protein
MPFDPTKPATNAPVASAELRDQLNGLKDLIDAIPPPELTQAELDAAIAGSSANSNGVSTLGMSAGGSYDPSQFQTVIDKIDELINALGR